MNIKEVANKIAEDYKKLRSMTVVEHEDYITLSGVRYRYGDNCATYAQVDYLKSFDNVDYQSKSNLLKANKWFISACIDIAQKYPNTDFYVRL